MCQFSPVKWNHRILLLSMVKMKCLPCNSQLEILGNWQPSHILISCKTIEQSIQGEILRLFVLQQCIPTICLTLLNQSECLSFAVYCNIASFVGPDPIFTQGHYLEVKAFPLQVITSLHKNRLWPRVTIISVA